MTEFHAQDGSTFALDSQATGSNKALLDYFLDRFPGGFFRYKAQGDGEIEFVSSGLLKLMACDTYEQFVELTGNTFKGMVDPRDYSRIDKDIAEQTTDTNDDRVQYRLRRRDGEELWVDDIGYLSRDEADGIARFYVTIFDITERELDNLRLKRANERLDILTALSNDVIFDIDCDSGKTEVFGDFEERFGRPPKQTDLIIHKRCDRQCDLEITEHDLSEYMGQVSNQTLTDFELSTEGEDGEPIWYRYQSVVLFGEDGCPKRHVGRLLDTHEMMMRETTLRRKAERDPLTGIYNRAAALDKIQAHLNIFERPSTLILIDVDDFKYVNDHYGHPEGDRVLKVLAEFLENMMRRDDIVARIGGDEFLVFAPGLRPGRATDRILAQIERGPFKGERETDAANQQGGDGDAPDEAAPTLSIGAVCVMNPPVTFAELYEAADAALYEAKGAGKAKAVHRMFENAG